MVLGTKSKCCRQRVYHVLGGYYLLMGAVATAAPAMAQTPATAAQNSESSGQLEEVVVTAQKRSENLQTVPIAVDVVNGAQLQASGVSTVEQLGTLVPGVAIGETTNEFEPRIRGVGTASPGPGVESPVALYVDGVYYSSQTWIPSNIDNVDQVSVLKGPQGTLFGRNATGGVIQITTADPTQNFKGTFSTGLDNFLTTRSDLYLSGGLTPDLAASVSLDYADQGLGYGRDINTGQAIGRFGRDLSVRSAILYTPTADTTITLRFDYANREGLDGSQLSAIPGTKTLFPAVLTYGISPWDTDAYRPTSSTFSGGGFSLTAQQNLSFAKLTDIVAFRQYYSTFSNLDVGLTPYLTQDVNVPLAGNQVSEELQLVSLPGSALQWAGGLYYFRADDSLVGSDGADLVFGGPLAPTPTSLGVIGLNSETVTNSIAGYGQATGEIFRATNLTVGLRYTHEDRSFVASESGFLVNGFSIGDLPLPAYAPKEDFDKLTWRFALDHEFTTDINSYVSYNRGFKSGGYNGLNPANPPYKPEQLDDYEIGLKTAWLDNHLRVNAAAFYYKYQNIQVTRYTNNLVIYNGAGAKLDGLDLDAEARFGHLKLRAGVEELHSYFTSFPGAEFSIPLPTGGAEITTGDAAGNRLPYAPKFTANIAADYGIDLGGAGGLNFNVTDAYNSGFYTEADNRIHQSQFQTLNASIGWSSASPGYSVTLYATNLLDKAVIQYGATQAFGYYAAYAPPRVYGFRLTRTF